MKTRFAMISLLLAAQIGFSQTPGQSAIVQLKKAYTLALEQHPIEATTQLYEGLKAIGNNAYVDTVMKQMYDILTIEEQRAYKITSHKGNLLLKAWRHRDPSPATPENERYAEHIQRLDHARRYYSSPQPRGYDDRGMIWIRYGEPDNQIFTRSARGIRANEGWAYQRYEPPIIFNFVEKGALYCLARDYLDFLHSGDRNKALALKGKGEDKIKQCFEEYLQDRIQLDIKYFKVYEALHGSSIGNFMDEYNETEMIISDQNSQHPRTITELELPGKLEAHIKTARFFIDNQTYIETYLSIPFDQLADSSGKASLRLSCTVVDDSTEMYDQWDKMYHLPLRSEIFNKGLSFTSQMRVKLPSGLSRYAFSIGHVESSQVYKDELEYRGFDVGRTDLFLSDIQLAADIQPLPEKLPESQKPFVKNNYLIRPYAFSEVNSERTLFFYLEAYNLILSPHGSSNLKVAWKVDAHKNLIDKLNPFGGRSYTLSSAYKQQGRSRTEPIFIALDIHKLMPGDYRMTFTVTDENTMHLEKREIEFTVKDTKRPYII
ncbi:GWxTD domain-containing protein [bacterium]|nr:GWxTD domain-containing protein [bacterium]